MSADCDLDVRCSADGACREVVDRLRAAELARYVLGYPEPADRLLSTAGRWAEIHNYGVDNETRQA